MEYRHTISDLKQMQSLPLEAKVRMTIQRINLWVDTYGIDNVYIAFSGGKDSTVLKHIIYEKMGLDNIPLVFVNVPTQYPELKQFALKQPNLIILNSEYSFMEICDRFGFPLISKRVAHDVNIARNKPNGRTAQKYFDKEKAPIYNSEKYKYLIDAPFSISDQCCYYLKKKPVLKYEKLTGKHGITAQTADESLTRREQWLKYGCNMFNNIHPRSNPMSFWTEQDILQYIKDNKVELCNIYGRLVYTKNLKLKLTGCQRTGCMMCGFGCANKKDNRFIQLKQTHVKLYNLLDICTNNGYTFRQAIEWTNKNGNLNIKL